MIFIFSLFVVKNISSDCYSSDGKTLNKVSDNSSELRISARCEKISDNCFSGLKSLISFYFEDNPNLTSIGEEAFKECSNLQSINLSSCTKLKTIGKEAFFECRLVSQIDLPKGLQEIGYHAFGHNAKITSIFIPASVKILDKFAFSNCNLLKDVLFESGSCLTKLDLYNFAYTKISSFQIPESVTEIHGAVFTGCPFVNLSLHPSNKNFIIENNVVYSLDKSKIILIGDKRSKTFHFPSHVTTIGTHCFYYNSNIVTIVIPNTIKRIENYAFSDCRNLKNFTFLGPVDYFGSENFKWCGNLKLVIFPPSTMKITYVFATNNYPFFMQFTCKIIFYPNTITINTNISISYYENTNLIINPNSLIMDFDQTTIFEFWGDNYQDSNPVLIPKTVTRIKENSFQNSSFTKLQIDSDSELLSIGNNAFYNCTTLQSLSLPSKLTFLGNSSFENCIQLDTVAFQSSLDLTIMKNSFKSCSNLKKVFNMTNVPGFCFSRCSKLSNVLFLDGVESIGRNSFQDCSSLSSLSLPSSVKTISDYSFRNCKSLSSIVIPSSCQLESFQLNSVEGCDSLKNISDFRSNHFECSFNTIYLLDSDKKQLILHLSKSIDEEIIINCDIICTNSFVNCDNVIKINLLPNGVSMIETSSFYQCINLKYINFPISVETIQSQSFIECNNLRCPVFENNSDAYLEMIILSGFSRERLNSCHVKGVTNGLNRIKKFFYCKSNHYIIISIIKR